MEPTQYIKIWSRKPTECIKIVCIKIWSRVNVLGYGAQSRLNVLR